MKIKNVISEWVFSDEVTPEIELVRKCDGINTKIWRAFYYTEELSN